MGRYLDLVRHATQIPSEAYPHERNEINEKRDESPSDPYAERFRAAIQRVNSFDCPSGVITWVREQYPILYLELIVGLPDAIHRLWSEHAPFDEFERILKSWVSTFQTACELFTEAPGSKLREPTAGQQDT
jgi:hypothetical protein